MSNTSKVLPFQNSRSMLTILNKGMISILDQALFSGSNFLLALMLGRWLTAADYGMYSVTMSIFLLAAGQYSSFILEPMSVIGQFEKDERAPVYFQFLFLIHASLTIAIMAMIVLATVIWKTELSSVIRMMAVMFPLTLSFWLTRWYYYMQLKPARSLFTSLAYVILLIAGLFFAKDFISSQNAYVLIGLASLFPCIPLLLRFPRDFVISIDQIKSYLRRHWDFGKWIGVASLLQWGTVQVYIIFVAAYLDLDSAANLRAAQNFANPMEQLSTALGLLLIPWITSLYSRQQDKAILKKMSWLSVIIFGIGIGYLLVINLASEPLFGFVYNGKYADAIGLTPYLVLVPIIMSLSRGAQVGVRVIQKTKLLLIAYASSAVVTILLGPIFIQYRGLAGAIGGSILSVSIFSLVINLLFFYQRKGIVNAG